jgi:RNase P subunit RPR2
MNRFPYCPKCKSELIESLSENKKEMSYVTVLRCTECEFEDHLLELWPEGNYECHFLGKTHS